MKKIKILGYLILLSLSCKAQTIIPVEQEDQYIVTNGILPNNTYLKDVNNVLNKYVGTWKTVNQNRTYTFIITNEIHTLDIPSNITEDRLIMSYIIKETATGVIIEDSSQIENGFIFGTGFEGTPHYRFYFSGNNAKCGNKGTLIINPLSPTQVVLHLYLEGSIIRVNCGTNYSPQNEATKPLLNGGLTLTKQ